MGWSWKWKRLMAQHSAHDFLASIVIPVHCYRQRASIIKKCLSALRQQTVPSETFEVLIVNNAAEEKDLWDGSFADFSKNLNFRIIHEFQRGSYAARNHGAQQARGHILAFIDSDCIPEPNWLEAGLNQIKARGEQTIIGGRIKKTKESAYVNAIVKHEALFTLNQRKNVKAGKFAATANLFVHRRFFEEVGPFNSHLLASGDVEWSYRCRQKGGKIFYSNQPCVLHPVVDSLPALIKRYRRKAGGYFAVRKINPKALDGEDYLGFGFKKARYKLSFIGIIRMGLNLVQKTEIILCALGKSPISG